MQFSSSLKKATLIKRYKRFLADVRLDNDEIITIHCANTGAMTGCAEPNSIVWYSESTNPKRKLPGSWELTQTVNNDWICINTMQANLIVKEAIEQQKIAELVDYQQIRSEVKYGHENSRIDLLLQQAELVDCYLEVKSVTLYDANNQYGYFPDAVTTRGQKHLRELSEMVKQGQRAIILFLIQHSAIRQFSPAKHIDPTYSHLLAQAIDCGVEVLCYKTAITTQDIVIDNAIPFIQ